MGDVGNGNVAHVGNKGLLYKRPQRVGGGRPIVISRRRIEPLIHEILEDSISEKKDSYSTEDSEEAPIPKVVVNENDPTYVYKNETWV